LFRQREAALVEAATPLPSRPIEIR
jgi:hypothetical protein